MQSAMQRGRIVSLPFCGVMLPYPLLSPQASATSSTELTPLEQLDETTSIQFTSFEKSLRDKLNAIKPQGECHVPDYFVLDIDCV